MKLNLKTLCMFYPKYILTFGLIFFIDFVTKIVAKNYLSEYENIEIIPNLFSLQLAFNKGVAFSFPVPYFLQIISGIVLLGVVLYWVYHYFLEVSVFEKWGVTFLLAGASANLWERIIAQHVTDFLHFSHHIYFDFSFPIFNIADIAIFFGVVLWFWGSIRNERELK